MNMNPSYRKHIAEKISNGLREDSEQNKHQNNSKNHLLNAMISWAEKSIITSLSCIISSTLDGLGGKLPSTVNFPRY